MNTQDARFVRKRSLAFISLLRRPPPFDPQVTHQAGGRGRGPRKALHNAKWITAIFDVLKRTEGALRHLRLVYDVPSAHRRAIVRACQSTLESIVLETTPRRALNVAFRFCRKIRKIDFSTTSSIPLWLLESIPASIEVLLNCVRRLVPTSRPLSGHIKT
ncbi:unnamed protein product [Sphagnum balticum]